MYYTETTEGVILNVKAQPRSSRAGIDGLLGDAVKVRIRCAPVDGKANKELIETLADAFGIPKGAVVFKACAAYPRRPSPPSLDRKERK